MKKSTLSEIVVLSLVALLAIISSCGKEEVSQGIDPELLPYIEAFENEAMKRGIQLDMDDLDAQIFDSLDHPSPTICGLGFCPGFRGFPAIEIDKDCWEDRSDEDKESLMFHELGHAVLERPHTDENLEFGFKPKSIMTSKGTANFEFGGPLRDYFIDELFDPDTPFPYSFQDRTLTKTVFKEDFKGDLEGWQFFVGSEEIVDWKDDPRIDLSNAGNDISSSISFSNEGAPNTWVFILKRFELENFNECSNLLARGDIVKTEGSNNIWLRMSLSLRERDVNGELTRFYIDRNTVFDTIDNGEVFEDFKVANYCIPAKSDVVTVAFLLWSESPATIKIENVSVELYE